jgi:hypothetical protein
VLWKSERKREAKKEIEHSKDLGVNGRLLIPIRSVTGGLGMDLSGSGQEQVVGCCERGDEPS